MKLTEELKQKIARRLSVMNGVYGKGIIIGTVFGVPFAGMKHDGQGMAVRQMQYGIDAKPFTIDLDAGTIQFISHVECIDPINKSETPE